LLRRYQYPDDLAGNHLSESMALDGGTLTITSTRSGTPPFGDNR
jgi:hypothetical protein